MEKAHRRPSWHSSVHHHLEQAGENVKVAFVGVQNIVQRATESLHTFGKHLMPGDEGMTVPAFASLSANLGRKRSPAVDNPIVGDISASPAEIRARLAGVPVYAVVNSKKEFILVSGDDDSGRQMSFLFFSKEDAEGFQATIKQENPKLGKTAQVLATSLEAVYELTTAKNKKFSVGGAENVSFRFMPDSKQVMKALDLYKSAGIPKEGFVGVPLFQAEGLTVKGDASRYTPLFFSKDDLDVALKETYSHQLSSSLKNLMQKVDRARAEMSELEEQVRQEKDAKAKSKAEKSLAEAKKRVDEYTRKLRKEQSEEEKKTYPRVDVGSFEEVLVKMQQDSKGDWSDVIFVPLNSLANKN